MGHHIQVFIGRVDILRDAAARRGGLTVTALAQNFALLPVTERLTGSEKPGPFPTLFRVTEELSAWAAAESRLGPIAYAETDYFGGVGVQAAVVWKDGRVVFGPVESWTRYIDGRIESTSAGERAINQALRMLGVEATSFLDECDAVGLGRYRSNRRWLAVGDPPV